MKIWMRMGGYDVAPPPRVVLAARQRRLAMAKWQRLGESIRRAHRPQQVDHIGNGNQDWPGRPAAAGGRIGRRSVPLHRLAPTRGAAAPFGVSPKKSCARMDWIGVLRRTKGA